MFYSIYLILYIIWFQFSLSLSPFYYFDYYEHQYFTSVLFHMFSFIKNALFGSYSWMSHRTFIESSAVTTAFWLDQYGGRFASIFRRCPPSMFWGQWIIRRRRDYIIGFVTPAIGPNKFKKLARLIAPVHNIRGKIWMKNNIHGFTDNKLIICEAMCTVFHSHFVA